MKIKELHLRNIASIEKADIDFEFGLNDIVTGTPADGYAIRRVSAEPATLRVAGTDSAVADCPVTEKLCKTVLSLPLDPYKTREEIDLVISELKKALQA